VVLGAGSVRMPEHFPSHSRFGRFNSRLGRCEFPVRATREFAGKVLILRRFFATK
jgi:hypothetical protein